MTKTINEVLLELEGRIENAILDGMGFPFTIANTPDHFGFLNPIKKHKLRHHVQKSCRNITHLHSSSSGNQFI